jgi:hypothetical protein
MTAPRTWAVAGLLLSTLAPGVAPQDREALVLSSNPVLAEIAAALLPDLARRSGLQLRAPVRLEERSREELVRYLAHKLDEELPEAEARATVEAYALLGLVPADLDLRGVLMGLYTEQVAGYYEPDSTALFVLDDQSDDALRGLLVHELVHAVQDQSQDLDALTDRALGSDRAAAAHAAIEGHATLVMFEYLAEQQAGVPVDVSAVPAFGALLRQGLEGVRAQFPALASAPRVLQESLLFPYVEGAVFMHGLWAAGERVAPFGDHLPASTEQILMGAQGADPIELVVSVRGGEIAHEDVLGRLELGVLVEEHLGPQRAALAEGWDGDRYVLVERPDRRRALVSYVVWESVEARDAFVEAMGSALDRFGAETRVRATQVSGHAVSVLTVGPVEGVEVRVEVREGT